MAANRDRIEPSVSPEARARIEATAATAGVSASWFMVNAAVERADELIARETTIVPADYFGALLATLDQPDPAPRLAQAAAASERNRRIVAR